MLPCHLVPFLVTNETASRYGDRNKQLSGVTSFPIPLTDAKAPDVSNAIE